MVLALRLRIVYFPADFHFSHDCDWQRHWTTAMRLWPIANKNAFLVSLTAEIMQWEQSENRLIQSIISNVLNYCLFLLQTDYNLYDIP